MDDFADFLQMIGGATETENIKSLILSKGGSCEPFTALFDDKEWVDFDRLVIGKSVVLLDHEKNLILTSSDPALLRPEKNLSTFFYGGKDEEREVFGNDHSE